MLFNHELASRGVRTYMTDPGATDTDITRDTTGVLPWVREHTFRRFPGAQRGHRRAVDHSGGDHRPAQRQLSCAAVQSVGQAEGDQAAREGS